MSEPDPTRGAVRVFNRSDRVWMFGLVWLIPFVVLGGTVAAPLLLAAISPALLLIPLFIILACQWVLDWLPWLAPVKYLRLTEQMEIVRVAGRTRSYSADRVSRLELAAIESADYDDRERGRQFSRVTVHLFRDGPARLVVSLEGLGWLTNWADAHEIQIQGLTRRDNPSDH